MKKQLFSLMMAFALVLGLSVTASAQDGLTIAGAIWHLPGSTHSISVSAGHSNTSYAWVVNSIDCTGAAAANATPSFTGGSESTHTAVFQYPDNAAGIYRFSVTETTTGDNGCSTTREFYTAIMTIDVVVVASNNLGAEITGAALSSCNDYTLLSGNTPATLVENTDADDNTNSLGTWQNASLYNNRWVNVSLTTADLSGACAGMTSAPAAGSFAWQFNYTVAGTNYTAPDNFITLLPATNIVGTGSVTYTAATDETNVVTVDRGVTAFTIPLQSFIRWGTTDVDQDQDFTFTVDSNTTVLDDDATLDCTDGREPVSRNTNNASASQHIDASPATPRITVTY